jgi:hypothetical protein
MKSIYVIGSLRNPNIPKIGDKLRAIGLDAFDDWFAAGPIADDSWKEYSVSKGQTYEQALTDYAAKHVFEFDEYHLKRCDLAVLVCPAGKSGHMELGWFLGSGKPGYILHDNPDRWDVMYQFANGVFFNEDDLIEHLKNSYV